MKVQYKQMPWNKDACLQQSLISIKDTSLAVAVLCRGDRILHINFL